MKRIIACMNVLCVSCLFALAPYPLAAWGQTTGMNDRVLVFLDEPSPPYSLGELGELSQGGISQDILTEICGRLGMSFELRLTAWSRALKTVEYGRADGMPLLMHSAERETYMFFTDPIIENREQFYYLPSRLPTFAWGEFSDLKPFTIGLIQGYTYSDSFLHALQEHQFKVIYSQDSESNLRKLLAGRVDLILEDTSLMRTLLTNQPEQAKQVCAADKPVDTYFWHMGLSRKTVSTDLVKRINSIIADMRTDGSLARILNKQ